MNNNSTYETMIEEKIAFIENYKNNSQNAASASKFDANANVATKNIATMEYELPKDMLIGVNRTLVSRKIEELYGKDLSNEYIRQIKNHEIYVHDETSLKPYCVSINMYPFLQDGLTKLGGEDLLNYIYTYIHNIASIVAVQSVTIQARIKGGQDIKCYLLNAEF